MAKRVLIAGFKHETNTFSVLPTDIKAYESRGLYRGEQLTKVFPGTNTEVAAFLDGCQRHGWEPVLSVVGDATPSGKLTRDCYETIAGEILADAQKGGPLAAVLLNLHGAMVAEHLFDGEGELLRRLREALGSGVVIAASLDLHANVTDEMARNADILVSYRTYPHIDMYTIASEVVDLVARTLAGEIRPKTIVARGRQIKGVDEGRTTSPGPMTEALAKAADLLKEKGVLSTSINAGFYKADIPEVGPSAVIVGDGDDPRYRAMAGRLVDFFWETRHYSTITHLSVADAVTRAKAVGRAGAPVVIADFADNPGGGGYSDSTGLLRGMIDAGLTNAAISTIYDPEALAECRAAGVGAKLTLAVGGKVEARFGPPVVGEAEVVHMGDGSFTIEGPMMTGMKVNLGPTATVRMGGVSIVIVGRRFQNYDLGYFTVAGIDPKQCSVLAVKSMQHFRAAYAPIASDILVVDEGGGITSHDIRRLTFRNVRRPVYPLDLE